MTNTPHTDGTGVHWQRKQAALRDLILRMLCGMGGIILDQSGGVASRIRDYYKIPNVKQNSTYISEVLRLMEDAGLIKRQMNAAGTCTYSIELIATLTDVQVIELEFYRDARLHTFLGTAPDPNGPEQVLAEVQTGYAAIQSGAKDAVVRNPDGQVAINVTRLLEDVGHVGQRARRIRYYLRTLGLTKSSRKYEGDQKLWLWFISEEEIPLHRLMALIVGEQNFEDWDETQQARKATRRAGTAVEDGDEPVDTAPVREAVTARPGPPPGRRAVTAQSVVAQASDGDTVGKLLGIIAGLEGRIEELTGQAEATEKTHRKELEDKDGEIADLQRQLTQRRQVDGRAADVIAKYSGK